jgi:hypothetical protein
MGQVIRIGKEEWKALCDFWLTDTNTSFSIEGLERLIPEQLKGEGEE